jgi:hypothetical protein
MEKLPSENGDDVQGDFVSPQPEAKPPEPYIKPYISVKKHGENGRLFDDLFHDDRYKKDKGRNYH